MRTALSVLAVIFLAASLPAGAKEPAQSSEEAQPKPEKPKKSCRTAKAKTGTRMGATRICKTADEWAAYDSENADKANQAVAGLVVTSGPNR